MVEEMRTEIVIRRADENDLPRIAELAGQLVRMHHRTDPERFHLPADVVGGYAWWFRRELARSEALLFAACRGPQIVGYAYGSLEGRDWNLLLDRHGAIHDVFVEENARRLGAGRNLLEALVRGLEALGAPRIVLMTMVGNEAAQALFRALGFRPTMLEMTR